MGDGDQATTFLSIRKKIVFIGNPSTGKTSLLNRICNDKFLPDYDSTIGVDFFTKSIYYNENIFKVQLWDSAGQEKYRSLTKFFYKDALMVIMVYDITRRESYDNVKNYWYKEIQENGEKNVVFGIAGNKSDLYEEEAVPEKEAREFAQSVNAIFALTSAQNNSGVNQLFEDMGSRFLDPNFQQKVQNEKKQVEKEQTPSNKIVLDKKDDAGKADGGKKKKGGFC